MRENSRAQQKIRWTAAHSDSPLPGPMPVPCMPRGHLMTGPTSQPHRAGHRKTWRGPGRFCQGLCLRVAWARAPSCSGHQGPSRLPADVCTWSKPDRLCIQGIQDVVGSFFLFCFFRGGGGTGFQNFHPTWNQAVSVTVTSKTAVLNWG